MQLHKCSIPCFPCIQKELIKNPLPSAISPPIRHACKFFWCADHYSGLNFHIHMPVSSHSASMLLPRYQVCPAGGACFCDAQSCGDSCGRTGRALSPFPATQGWWRLSLPPKILAGADLPAQEQEGGGESWQIPAAPLEKVCFTYCPIPFLCKKYIAYK